MFETEEVRSLRAREGAKIKTRFSATTLAARGALAVAALYLFAGCSGGADGAQPTPAAPESLFVPANQWPGEIPAGFETITPDEFRRRYIAGDLQLVTPAGQQAQRDARQRHLDAERAFLEAQPDLSDAVKELLEEVRVAGTWEAGAEVTLADGQKFGLIDLGSRIEEAAENYRRARDPAQALASYELSYSLLPDAVKAQVPAPATLRGNTIDQIRQATVQLDAALATTMDWDSTRIDSAAPAATPNATSFFLVKRNAGEDDVGPGIGTDNAGECAQAGYARRYWFPLRAFVSPVRSQAKRGTCWAFTALASLESRERVQNDSALNLSEQFLINKVKGEWREGEYTSEGGSAGRALMDALERGQVFAPEAAWIYNPATNRLDVSSLPRPLDVGLAYKDVCKGYKGLCSETAHQGPKACTNVLGLSFCGYSKVKFDGPGVTASPVRLIWSNDKTFNFNLNQYRLLLASGASLMASFPVYEGFMATPADGIVSNYAKMRRDKDGALVSGSYGGHAVQIIGFISNEQLSFPGAPVAVGGGGYFIIRNSWGCAADGGYYYVPADYVSGLFKSLEVLDFDSRRSGRWNEEQVVPGGTSGLIMQFDGTGLVDLRVPTPMEGTFVVAHPVANYVRLTVTSDRDGTLFDGQWLVNPPVGGALFRNSLRVNFPSPDDRTLTFTARYGTQVASVKQRVIVWNSPPGVLLEAMGTPQQNESFVVNAAISDPNEANPAAMCAAMTWAVDAPDTIVSGSGCTRVIRFGATGERQVRATTRDTEGREGNAFGRFIVAPPPANPFPRITSLGVYSRDPLLVGGQRVGCSSNEAASAATIDLRQRGCQPLMVGAPEIARFVGQITVENPAAEGLSYDWTYTLRSPISGIPPETFPRRTATPTYEFNPVAFGAADTAYACTLDVRVNAPDAARSKALRVWSGQCINGNLGPR